MYRDTYRGLACSNDHAMVRLLSGRVLDHLAPGQRCSWGADFALFGRLAIVGNVRAKIWGLVRILRRKPVIVCSCLG